MNRLQASSDPDVLAEALRELNMSAHPHDPWQEVTDEHVLKIWRDRADTLRAEIRKATEKRVVP